MRNRCVPFIVRVDDSDDVMKCWLSPNELDRLERTAGEDGWGREVAIQMMGRCAIRTSEVSYPSETNLRYSDDGDIWLFEAQGKNTNGGSKTILDAWMPDDVTDNIHKYSREQGLDLSDQWVGVSTPTVRQWVKEAAHAIAEQLTTHAGDPSHHTISAGPGRLTISWSGKSTFGL